MPEGTKYDVEDGGYAMIRFDGGLVMHLEVTWAANVTETVPRSTWTGYESEDTTLYGDRATLRLNPPTLYTMEGMERRGDPAGHRDRNPTASRRRWATSSIRSARATPPVSNVDQAVSLMKMLMAIYESSATGMEVRLRG